MEQNQKNKLWIDIEKLGIKKIYVNDSPFQSYNKHSYRHSEIGKYVAVRPVSEDKTYLGIYIGDLPLSFNAMYITGHEKSDIAIEMSQYNPAIFVFALNKLVFGIESWWYVISNPEDLKEISDDDINSVWYVKALKELSNESN